MVFYAQGKSSPCSQCLSPQLAFTKTDGNCLKCKTRCGIQHVKWTCYMLWTIESLAGDNTHERETENARTWPIAS